MGQALVVAAEVVLGGDDGVRLLLEAEGGRGQQDEEADVRQRVRDELGGGAPQRVAQLEGWKG